MESSVLGIQVAKRLPCMPEPHISCQVMPEPESKVDDRTPRRLEPLEASVGKESPVIVKDLDRESKDSDTR